MNYPEDLLTIPEFLCRKPKRGRPRKTKKEDVVSIENRWAAWDKIKQKRYGTRYDIHLGDEAPRIGSGLRIVYVKEGRKWAHMVAHTNNPDQKENKIRKRFPLKRWLEMKASHEKYVKRNERAMKKLQEKANETNS